MPEQLLNSQYEKPNYILSQQKERAIVPKIITLIGLGVIFYLGVLLNVSLLDLNASEETSIQVVSLIILLVIIIIGIYLAKRHAQINHLFFKDRIVFEKNTIHYLDIINTSAKTDFIDRIFNTYNINLGNGFILRHIPEEIQIEDYLKQLIEYSKKQQAD